MALFQAPAFGFPSLFREHIDRHGLKLVFLSFFHFRVGRWEKIVFVLGPRLINLGAKTRSATSLHTAKQIAEQRPSLRRA